MLENNIIINPTKITQIQKTGYIAKLNNDKTKIINIYINKKVAYKLNNIKSINAIDMSVKNETILQNNYYMYYDNCNEKLKNNFEIPILYTNGVGQFDENNILLREFRSKEECRLLLKISDKTIKKSIEQNIKYDNFYYKYLDKKIKI